MVTMDKTVLISHHWSYTSGESRNRVCVCLSLSVCLPFWTNISVTASMQFLILSTMMAYGLGMMSAIFVLIQSIIPETQTKIVCFWNRFQYKRYTGGCLAAHSLGLFSSMLLIT